MSDNPYTPLALIEEERKGKKPSKSFGYAHIVLVVLAVLPFVYCLVSPLLLEYRAGWQNARAFLFVVGYIGLFFRKEWAYWLCFIIPMTWVIQIVLYLENATPNPNEQGLVMIFTTLYAAFAVWFAVIALLAFICALTFLRQPKRNDPNKNIES